MGDIIEQLKQLQAEQQGEMRVQADNSVFELVEELDKQYNKNASKEKAEKLMQALYQKTVDNIRLSESLRMDVNKSDFTNKDEVIDTLLYTIGLIARDPLFYLTNVRKLEGHEPKYKV